MMTGQRVIRAITVAITAVLLYEFIITTSFFARHSLELFAPVIVSDLNADLDFFSKGGSLESYLFAFHNEHVVATTRAISALDFSFFGAQYRIHQYAAILALTTTLGIIAALIASLRRNSLDLYASDFGIVAFVGAVVFAPAMVAVVAFPYFLTHPLATVFGLLVAVFAALLHRKTRPPLEQILLVIGVIVTGLLTLISGAHGLLLVLAGLLAPLLMWRPRWDVSTGILISLALASVVVWKLFFAAETGGLVGKLFSPSQWPAIVDYVVRILSLPAHFVARSLRLTIAFGTILGLCALSALYIAATRVKERKSATLTVFVALLVGHFLTVALISFGRAGTPWGAEDPKYLHYAAIICGATACTLYVILRNHALARLAVLGICTILGALFLNQRDYVLTQSRQFYRTLEVLGTAAAVGVKDPEANSLLGTDENTAKGYDYLRANNLNLFSRRPMQLIGKEISSLAVGGSCTGSVVLDQPMPMQRRSDQGRRLEGWAFDKQNARHKDETILVTDATGRIVGIGTFISRRPDIFKLLKDEAISPEAPLGWRAYVGPIPSAKFSVYVANLPEGTACKFADKDV
jgi:hypothetical protein